MAEEQSIRLRPYPARSETGFIIITAYVVLSRETEKIEGTDGAKSNIAANCANSAPWETGAAFAGVAY